MKSLNRFFFLIGSALSAIANSLRGRGLATNVVFTPQQTSHGTVTLDGTAAIATKNYVVVRGADDRHFKLVSAVTDVPLGILLNDEIATDEVDVVPKNIALFGLWPESLPAVAEAAIAVDAWLTPGVGTLGRVKTLPVTTAGTYWVIGKSRFTVAAAGDPVSIAHCVPFQVTIGQQAEVVITTNVITADESGKTFYLDLAGGFTSTLPAVQLGLRFIFIVKTAPTTAYIILSATNDNIIGYPVASLGSDETGNGNAAGDQINFVANTALPGDRVVVDCDGTSWHAVATCKATGAITITG